MKLEVVGYIKKQLDIFGDKKNVSARYQCAKFSLGYRKTSKVSENQATLKYIIRSQATCQLLTDGIRKSIQ